MAPILSGIILEFSDSVIVPVLAGGRFRRLRSKRDAAPHIVQAGYRVESDFTISDLHSLSSTVHIAYTLHLLAWSRTEGEIL